MMILSGLHRVPGWPFGRDLPFGRARWSKPIPMNAERRPEVYGIPDGRSPRTMSLIVPSNRRAGSIAPRESSGTDLQVQPHIGLGPGPGGGDGGFNLELLPFFGLGNDLSVIK